MYADLVATRTKVVNATGGFEPAAVSRPCLTRRSAANLQTTYFDYDLADRLVREETPIGDARGLVLRMTDPEGGEYRFGYDALGRRTATTYPNGMTLEVDYDVGSRVTQMSYRNRFGQSSESFAYSYDARGNRASKTFADGRSEVYGYDELSRLTSVSYASGREVHYEYDAVGNRLTMIEGSAGLSGTCAGETDCDSFADTQDNCPLVANDQTNSDTVGLNTDGAAAAWRFEEQTGTTAFSASGVNHATLGGARSQVTAPTWSEREAAESRGLVGGSVPGYRPSVE